MSERARAREEQRATELETALRPASEASLRPEVVVTRLRRQGRALTFPVVLLLATATAAGFFIGSFEELWQNLLALALALVLVFGGVLLPVSAWLGNTATITTRRVIVRQGLLTRTRSEVALSRIREIRSRASILQRLFGAGTIEFVTGTEDPTVIADVASVNGVVDMLHELLDRTYVPDQTGAFTGAQVPLDTPHSAPNQTEVL